MEGGSRYYKVQWQSIPLWLRDSILAAVFAWFFSGIPSTSYTLLTHGDIYEATLAAGSILVGQNASFKYLIASAVIVHSALSLFWATILTILLPRKFIIIWSILAGFGIAILDLLIIGQFFPKIKALSFLPQLADHLAFGGIVGIVLYIRHKRITTI